MFGVKIRSPATVPDVSYSGVLFESISKANHFTCREPTSSKTEMVKLRIGSRQSRFGGVSVTFSLCYYTKGTKCMTYIAKYPRKCPIS